MDKFVFVSNYFNHHQKPFSDAMWKLTGCSYKFVETEGMSKERVRLGYKKPKDAGYVDSRYTDGDKKSVIKLINEADAVIFGSGAAPEKLIQQREKNNKLTFRYSERFFKKTHGPVKNMLIAVKRMLLHKDNGSTYILCSGAFTPTDYAKLGKFKGKFYKWGYFPEFKRYDSIDCLIETKHKSEILWCGRLIDWKHPDDAVAAAQRLKSCGYDFCLNIIGTGEMEEMLKQKIKENNLQDCVHMLGSMPPEKVREHMESAEIFMFTSDQSEGWGAVLNEAMNSGCTVVAGHEIGSVPFMVRDGENAFVYKSRDVNDLFAKVKFLLDNPQKAAETGKKAYLTIAEEWNADVAAERLTELTRHIQNGEKCPQLYQSGPCSTAEILTEDWFAED